MDGGADEALDGSELIADGEWTGWRIWHGDPFEDRAGPYYFREGADGRVRTGFRAEAKHMNGSGFMHGGAFLTFADYALFIIARKPLGDTRAVTVTLNGEFIGPAHVGELVEATGEVVRAGGSLVFMRGLITAAGRPAMTFSGVVKKVGPRTK